MRGDLCLTRAEISLEAARENVKKIKKISRTSVLAVVKADAYAHGARRLAPEFIRAGATHLCAASAAEGIELRETGIKAPIIILNPAAPFEVEVMAEHNLTPAVVDLGTAEKFSIAARKLKHKIKIHLEIDTGLGRSGFLPGEALENVKKISSMKNIEIEGMFTHFSCADEDDPSFTESQIESFEKLTGRIEAAGIIIPLKHTSNSAGIMAFPHKAANTVRPGLLLYGLSPFPGKPAPTLALLTLKTRIINIRKIPAGSVLSYGRTHKTAAESVIATLPAGYADGYDRRLSNRASVIINGKKAPVVGRICMDRCLVDITGIRAKAGDEAVLIGKQGGESVTLEELSQMCGTVPNEFISRLGKRIKRVYI